MKITILLVVITALAVVEPAFSQNVGIGIEAPTRAKLEVHGAVGATSAIFGGETTGVSMQSNWPGIGFNSYFGGGNRLIATGYAARQYLNPSNGFLALEMIPYGAANSLAGTGYSALIISPFGNVGLGGATPNGQLQLSNTLNNRKIVLWETANNNYEYFGLGIEPGTMRYNVANTSNVHRFYSGNGAFGSNLLMSIWGDKQVLISDIGGGGKLGINLNSAPYTLSLKQAGGTGIYVEEAGSSTNWEFRATYYPGNANLFLRHQGANVAYFRSTGEYIWYSDRRLKTNVEEMPPVLSKLLKLQPKIYEMKANNIHHEKTIGFVAQEVKPLFPELVFVSKNEGVTGMEDLHAVSYSGFGVLAVKGLQEQQVQIDELKKEVNLLKEQNKILMQLLNKN